MSAISPNSNSKAFTLMEMIVVVILVGIIYALMLTYLKPKRENISLGIASKLRALLLPYWNHSHIYLICGNRCKSCAIYDNNSLIAKDIPFPLNIKVKGVYGFDDSNRLEGKEFLTPFLSDEKICLRYDLYPNKSNSELFIEDENGSVLYFPPYFNTFKSFASLQSAKDHFEDIKMELSR